MGCDSLAMVFLKDKTLTRYFPDVRTQGGVFVIIFFACPAPIYDKDQMPGVAGQPGKREAGSSERTLLEEQPSVHSNPFQSAKVACRNPIFNLGFHRLPCGFCFTHVSLSTRVWVFLHLSAKLAM